MRPYESWTPLSCPSCDGYGWSETSTGKRATCVKCSGHAVVGGPSPTVTEPRSIHKSAVAGRRERAERAGRAVTP